MINRFGEAVLCEATLFGEAKRLAAGARRGLPSHVEFAPRSTKASQKGLPLMPNGSES